MLSRIAFVLAALLLVVPVAARSDEATATLNGTVTSTNGAAVAGADITATGASSMHTSTDATGHFSLTLPTGLYSVTVNRGGYSPATLESVALTAGGTQTVSVVLAQADLSSLRTIARVSTSRRSSINTGAAAVAFLPREEITNYAVPQLSDLVARIPGASVEKGSSSPNVSVSLGGSQPYETQVLIDGHPISAGRYGVWFSQFFNPYLLGGIETQIGPGNTTPFAGTAVGGTANFVTPGFTAKDQATLITGIDSYGSQYSSLLASGRLNKLSYVIGAAYGGENGMFFGRSGCILNPATKNTWYTPGATGTIQYCGNLGSSFFTKGEILKARYDFSPVSSLELGFIGSQAGYLPQATSYGVSAGVLPIAGCLPSSGNGATGGPPGEVCTAPGIPQAYVGKSINGYFFYPGSNVYNNQPLFTGQFRSAIGNNTILVRPYAGNITRIVDGSGESGYAQFWYPSNLNSTYCTGASGTFGEVGPTESANGQSLTECYNSAFSVLESDKLKGSTFSFIHPFGANALNFTYDFHSDETFAYYNSPSNVAVPDTTARFNTLSVTGDFNLRPNLEAKAGLYDDIWNLSGTQTGTVTPSGGGKPVVTTVGLTRTLSRFDPHVALLFHPEGGLAYRAAFGTSTTFPYASQVSGLSSINQKSGTGGTVTTLIQKDPGLVPERANELDLGVDKRFGNGSVLSLDLFSNQIRNVFETLTTPVSDPTLPYQQVQQPVNAARLNSQFAMLTYRYEPQYGLGFYATLTAAKSIVTGIPLNFYPAAGFGIPANDTQQCSDGGNNVCIPYFKAYGRLEYTMRDKTYLGLGMDLEGKNNTYFQPPFALFDFTARHPVTARVSAQVSVQNLLNTNVFAGLVQPNSGVAITGQNSAGHYGPYGGSGIAYPLIPAAPRTVRFQLQYAVGQQP